MKIYDLDGNESDWTWLESEFGPEVRVDPRPDLTRPGFEVIALQAGYGHSTLLAEVRAGNGLPLANVLVARWWDDPSLGALPIILQTWRDIGIAGRTKEEGTIGFGMGGGDQYNWNAENPAERSFAVSEIWVEGNSGRVHGLGWPWGKSQHLDTIFQFTETDPGPPPDPNDDIDEVLDHLRVAEVNVQEAIRRLEAL